MKKQSEEKSIVFKSAHLKFILEWITMIKIQDSKGDIQDKPLLLHGPLSRSRNRIVALVTEEMSIFEKSRMDLIKKFGELDKDGNPKTDETGKNYIVKDQKAFDKEYDTMLSSDVVFDILPSNKIDWVNVKTLICRDNKSVMDYATTKVYEEVCVIFETL